MSAIDRYIVRQILVATALITVVLIIVVWLAASLRVMDYIVNQGLPIETFLLMTSLLLPRFLPVIVPIALFVSVLWIYQRLVTDSELMVLRATGVSDLGLARPALILAVAATAFLTYLNFEVGPAANRGFKEMQFVHRHDFSSMLIQSGEFKSVRQHVTIHVRQYHEGDELTGILLHDDRDPEVQVTLMAEHGRLISTSEGPRVVLQNGNRQEIDRSSGRVSMLYFDKYTLDLSGLAQDMDERWRDPAERYLDELFSASTDEYPEQYVREFRAEAHFRISSSLYALASVLVGLSILLCGEFNRRGYFWRILAAVIIVPAILLSHFTLKGVAIRVPATTPLLHLSLVIPATLATLLLVTPRSMRRLFTRSSSTTAEQSTMTASGPG